MGKVWAISTNKGGVLKTSVCSNLSGVLAQKGSKVCIIDTDNQGNILLSFGKNPDECELTLYDVLVEGAPISDAVMNVYSSSSGSIDVIPANDDMAFFEFDVLTERNKYPEPFKLLKVAAEGLREQYDYILIDSPPNLGLTTGNILTFADEVLIPFQPENYSMRSLVKILNAIQDFKLKNNQKLNILGVVATLVDQRTTLHTQVLQECRRFCLENDIQMLDTVIPRSVRFASSVAYEGLPATLTDHKNKLVSAYFDLLEELKEGATNG